MHWTRPARPPSRKRTPETPAPRQRISDWITRRRRRWGSSRRRRFTWGRTSSSGTRRKCRKRIRQVGEKSTRSVHGNMSKRAEHFLTQWKLYVSINISNRTIANYYQRSTLFLTYIQGVGVSEWGSSMCKWLQRQVIHLGIQMTDHWLWDSTLVSFKRQFTDTL